MQGNVLLNCSLSTLFLCCNSATNSSAKLCIGAAWTPIFVVRISINIKEPESGSRAPSGSVRLISRYDNLSVLVSLMSHMSMPSSFFALCILTLWGAFWGGLLHFQGGSLVSPVG